MKSESSDLTAWTDQRKVRLMAKINEEVTGAELSVLEALWKHPDGVPVRDIVLAVYGRHEHSLHAGVKSFLDRLMEKGLVRVDKSGFAHQFFATMTQQQFVGQHLKKLADSHFGGALTPLLLSLLDQVKLKPKDRAIIEKMVEKMED